MNNPRTKGHLEETLSKALVQAVEARRFADVDLVRPAPRVSMNGADAVSKLKLLERLQTSLDLEVLLQIFDECLTDQVAADGVRFFNALRDIDISLAHQAEHKLQCTLMTDTELVGQLSVSRTMPFMEYERQMIRSFADLLVYPIRNALLHREALSSSMQDPLTGAGNRTALHGALQHEMAMMRRYQQPMALLLLDMDNFRVINEVFDHAQGDEVLIRLVESLQANIRATDAVFRSGGEEFVILLANTGLAEAVTIAERMRKRVEALALEQDGVRIITTSSIGIAMLLPEDSMGSLLKRADTALRDAKRAGRNQVRGH